MDITARNGRWLVRMDWPEVHDIYDDEESTPVERAISAVGEEHEIARKQLRSSVVRATEGGMTVVVEFAE